MVDPARARELAEAGLSALDNYESAAQAGIDVPERIRQARMAFEGAAAALKEARVLVSAETNFEARR